MKIFLQVFVSMIIYILCISGLKSDDPRISSHLFSEFESIKTNPARRGGRGDVSQEDIAAHSPHPGPDRQRLKQRNFVQRI